MFARMIVIAKGRELNMKDVLCHPLGPIPWALANEDSSIRRTEKSRLMNKIKANTLPVETLPEKLACIIDGMSIVHKINVKDCTFSEISTSVLRVALNEGLNSQRIDIVFDVYNQISIKDAERGQRGLGTGIKFNIIVPGHKPKNWRSFLSEGDNKTKFIEFLLADWTTEQKRELIPEGKELFVTLCEKCWKITREEEAIEIETLKTSQEEADTHIVLHAKHAYEYGYQVVLIVSDDTDVFILLISFSTQIGANLFQKFKSKARTYYQPISIIVQTLGDEACRALLGFHAFTGCDSVSSFLGRGKTDPFGKMCGDPAFLDAFSQLGQNWDVPHKLFQTLQQFTCSIYMPTSKTKSVNQLRYEMFIAKRGEAESQMLPPCADSLQNHAKRANYQACIWKHALENSPFTPSPNGHGWIIDENNNLSVKWVEGKPAPDAILEMLVCHCKRSCDVGKCACLQNGLKCTPMCRLQNCDNQAEEPENFQELDYEGEEEGDDD